MFWYFVGFLSIKNDLFNPIENILKISNQGLTLLGLNFSGNLGKGILLSRA